MAYCPKCRSEYRRGVERCASCGGVSLVDTLPEPRDLRAEELATARPVSVGGVDGVREVEVDGHSLDPARIFVLATASELKIVLDGADVPSAIVPLDIDLPDGVPRFEVRVRPGDYAAAQDVLSAAWREQVAQEGGDGAAAADVETCPACGAHVPLDVDECPDCGLGIGAAEEDAGEEHAEPA